MSDGTNSDRTMILAIETARLPKRYTTDGYHLFMAQQEMLDLDLSGLWIGPRTSLESNEAFRQLIPYIVLRVDGNVVSYVRTSEGSEGRLHGRRSIGFGGHVELNDIVARNGTLDVTATLENAASREVKEEIGPVLPIERKWRGVLVSNHSPVSRVHIGIVAYWRVAGVGSTHDEGSIGDVQITPAKEIAPMALEDWSARVLSDLQSGIA